MKNNAIKCSFLLSCTFLGAVIGAGFASGKELTEFFLPFDKKGVFGVFLACILLAAYFYAVTKRVSCENIKSTHDYLICIANPFFAKIIYIFIYVFAFVIFCAMFAGSGALFKQIFNFPYFFGSCLMGIICCIIFYRNIYGILSANAYLTPLMILGIFYVGIAAFFRSRAAFFEFGKNGALICSSLVYASYNSIIIISVFFEMGSMLKDKKTPFLSAVISGSVLFAISLVLYLILLFFKEEAQNYELPILQIAENAKFFYTAVMFFAMITTAVSSLFSLMKFLENTFSVRKNSAAYICIAAIFCSFIGFSKMVSFVYPIFGCLGFFLLIYIIGEFFALAIGEKYKSLKIREKIKNSKKNGNLIR